MNKNKKEKLKSACEESERKERVEKVTALLSGVNYKNQKEKEAAILSFSRANLSYEEIEQLIKPLRPDYLVGQEFRKGVY